MKNLLFSFLYVCILLSSGQLQAQNDLQDRYDWLVAFADPNDCTTEKVEEYESFVGYKYLLITFTDGSQQLHNAEGTFYCRNAENYDCVAAYRLNGPIATWTCSDPQTAEDDLIRRLQNSGTNCYSIISISKIEYEGNNYYQSNAGNTLRDLLSRGPFPCGVLESFPSLYDSEGRRVCDFGFTALPCPIARNVGTLVWTNEDANCIVEDPFSVGVVQRSSNEDRYILQGSDTCKYVKDIIQFDYNGFTFFRINEAAYNSNCASAVASRFYSCTGDFVGGVGNAPTCQNAAVCQNLDLSSTNGTVIWSFVDPSDECFVTISNTQCRRIGVYDANDRLLTTMNAGPHPFGPLDQPASVWEDTRPLDGNATRTYIFKENNLILGQQAVTCDTADITVVSNQFSGCTDALGIANIKNVGCRTLGIYATNGTALHQIAPQDSVFLSTGIRIYIFLADQDTLTVASGNLTDANFNTGGCGDSNNAIFEDYPWLTDLVNPTNCSEEKVEVYQTGIYTYLLVTNASGVATLYNQNGQFYCENSSNYDCVAAYNLGAAINTWTCTDAPLGDCLTDEQLIQELTSVYSEFCYELIHITQIEYNGQRFFKAYTGITPFSPVNCLLSDSFAQIYDCEGKEVCTQPLICDDLFLQEERSFWTNPDFLACGCTDLIMPVCGVDGKTYRNPCYAECVGVAIASTGDCADDNGNNESNEELFNDYPWLSTLFNATNCSNEKVAVYQTGIYTYLLVTDAVGVATLYNQDGQFYCQNSANYDCLAAYNLTEQIDQWTCTSTPVSACQVNITNNECRFLRIYDETDVLLTVQDGRPSSIRPNEVWEDTRPLAGGESRTYIFRDGILELGRQIVTCANPNIALVNRYEDGCTENRESSELTNTGCNLLRVFNSGGGLMGRAFPGETLVLEDVGQYQIMMVGNDTIEVSLNFGIRNIDTGGCPDRTNYNNVQIFETYAWLTDVIDLNNCSTESVEVWRARTTIYLWVLDENGNGTLYTENGLVQCRPTPSFPINCFQAYELRELVAVWICGRATLPTDCAEGSIAYEGTVIENECGSYVLTTDNQYITIGTSIPVGTTISFNFSYITHEDGSCPTGQPNALFGEITCLEIISEPSNCQHTGTIFFDNCDDGRIFYFLRMEDGRIVDPYFDETISFNPIDGQRIKFDFVDANFSSPCSIAEKAIILTCVEEIAESNLEGSIPENFEDYDVIFRMCKGDTLELPWLTRTLYHNCPVYCPPPGVCGPPGPEVQFERWSGSNLSFDRVNDKVLLYPTETTTYTAHYPSFTCPPIRNPNEPAGPQGVPIVESTDRLTYLVIVEEDANCIASSIPEETVFDVAACVGDRLRLPAPHSGECPIGPPIEESVAELLLYGQNVIELKIKGEGSVRVDNWRGNVEGTISIECPKRTYIYNITCPDTGTTEDAIFSEFSWLSDIVNPTACNGETISVYQLGDFKYVYISSATDGLLYFQDGTFYCMDAPNYNCRNVYGLSRIIATWNCANLLPESKERRRNEALATSFFTIAPNPTTDRFTIQLPEVSDKDYQVQVIDMLGRVVHQTQLAASTTSTTIDLADYQNGIYYVQLKATGIRSIKKLVKQGLD